MARRKPRTLRQEEIELWKRVADTTAPLHPTSKAPVRPDREEKQVQSQPKKTRTAMPRFTIGEEAKSASSDHVISPTISEQIARQPLAMDKKRFGKMKKGRLSPEARIDLHGMTTAQAHPALVRFVLDAVSRGQRLVLIITGKGKTKPDTGPIPERHGVLRHQVPHWLNTPPLNRHVLQISEAHVKHGGTGAYYVYLRRAR